MACGGTTQFPGLRRRVANCSKAVAALACLIVALAAPSAAAPSAPAPVKTTLTVTTDDGYARLVFTAGEYIDGTARQAGNVLIISFKQSLDVAVNRVAEQAPDYIGAARRDPDGTAVRRATRAAGLAAVSMGLAAAASMVAAIGLYLWAPQYAGYHQGWPLGIYLPAVLLAVAVAMVSAVRGVRSARSPAAA